MELLHSSYDLRILRGCFLLLGKMKNLTCYKFPASSQSPDRLQLSVSLRRQVVETMDELETVLFADDQLERRAGGGVSGVGSGGGAGLRSLAPHSLQWALR